MGNWWQCLRDLESPIMSRPAPNFSLGSLNFNEGLLGTQRKGSAAQSPALSALSDSFSSSTKRYNESTPIADDGDKEARLASGKTIELKRRNKKTNINPDLIATRQNEDYGFNINGLFAKLEVERLKETTNGNKAGGATSLKTFISNVEPGTHSLWVEKWRPRTFLDFVGNELANRRILKWLKQWDKVVFDKNLRPVIAGDESHKEMKFIDALGRPSRKVLLIHGPPGIGKTTIAHVIAKQCGYEVMEINASDERAGQRVKDKISNSISSITFSGKPACLIADEIDGGSEFGFIKVLNDLIYQDQKMLYKYNKMQSSKFWSENDGANKKKFLMRPIIAICNDLYVPALEKLRLNSEIISFQQINENSLRERLKFVCKNENIVFSNQQLKEVIQLTNHDIRACLNILQFSGKDGSDTSINKGKKDMQISWYSIVSEIFKKSAKLSKKEQFKSIQHLIHSHHSNFDKIINGCFQAYNQVHYQDMRLSKPSMISDWIFFSDLVNRTAYESNGVDLSHYSELTALKFFELFSDLSNTDIKIKSQDWEFFEKGRNNLNIIKMMFNKLTVNLRQSFKLDQMIVELLPALEEIITPALSKKSLHSSSLPKMDQSKVTNAAKVITATGLLINNAKDENYNEIYMTFPDFSAITKYDTQATRKLQIRQTKVFPIIQKELEAHKSMKRKHDQAGDDAEGEGDTTINDIETLKNQYNQIAENERLAKKQKVQKEIKIWVRYHEGFSNAVRKKVRWADLG